MRTLIAILFALCATTLTHAQTITEHQKNLITLWAIEELHHAKNDFCYKPTYGNGVGFPLGCAPGLSMEGALCYSKCQPGYYNTPAAAFCYRSCPSGFRDDGLYCAKPAPYGRGAGRSCLSGWSCGCNADEDLNGLMCYPKCRANFHPVGCCICSPDCPSGWNDIGVSCTKPYHGRSITPISTCPTGSYQFLALCYPNCKSGYYAVGTVCWRSCGASEDHPNDCGVGCSTNTAGCVVNTINMVFAPLAMFANILSYGSANVVAKAMNVLIKTAGGQYRLTEATVQRLLKYFQRTANLNDVAMLADFEIQTIMFAVESSVKNILGERLVKAYGQANADVLIQNIGKQMTFILIIESILDLPATAIEFLDPTGVISVIKAYAKPLCRPQQTPPALSTLPGGTSPSQSVTARVISIQPSTILLGVDPTTVAPTTATPTTVTPTTAPTPIDVNTTTSSTSSSINTTDPTTVSPATVAPTTVTPIATSTDVNTTTSTPTTASSPSINTTDPTPTSAPGADIPPTGIAANNSTDTDASSTGIDVTSTSIDTNVTEASDSTAETSVVTTNVTNSNSSTNEFSSSIPDPSATTVVITAGIDSSSSSFIIPLNTTLNSTATHVAISTAVPVLILTSVVMLL